MISPITITRPVVVAVSHATRAIGSSRMIASRIASLTWSQSLSGWPSVTDSDVNRYSGASTMLVKNTSAADRGEGITGHCHLGWHASLARCHLRTLARMAIEAAPYRASWVNAVIDWVGRLPGPPSLAYLVAIVPAILVLAAADWISGKPIGEIQPDRVVWGLALVGSIWLIHHLDAVARRALREFSPMLEVTPEEEARLAHELTVIPRTPALLIVGFAVLRTAEGFALEPETEGLAGLTPFRHWLSGSCSRRSCQPSCSP